MVASVNARNPAPSPACRARSGDYAHAATGIAMDDRRIVRQSLVELFDHGRRRAFLWSEDCGCAVGAGQRVGDVAGQYNRRARNARVETGCNRCGRGSASAAPPTGRSRSSASSSRMPRAWAMPAPPSLVALPPSPTMMRSAPWSERIEDQFSDARAWWRATGRAWCRRDAVPRLRPSR